MGSYTPRHLKREPNVLNKVSRRGVAFAAAGAVVVPAVGMESASAAPVAPHAATAATTAKAVSAVSALKSAKKAGPTIYYGSRGAAVKVVQKRVGGLSVDGVFGAKTKAKVKSYQRKKGLTADGVVGAKTWAKLGGYSSSSSSSGSSSSSSTSSSSVVRTALALRGTPYRYGGTTASGFDCSGFTSYVYKKAGKSLPRTARAQAAATTRVSSPKAGDLVFWGYPAYHVAIYVGNGKVVAARKPGTVVSTQNLWGSYYFGRV